MNIVEAIILGIIQGATEFLPISSSGHLVITTAVLGLEANLDVISIAHLGSLVAVLIYFWRDLVAIVRGVLSGLVARRPLGNADARLGWLIVFGSIPAAVVGLTLEEQVEQVFTHPLWAGLLLLGTAGILLLGERLRSGRKPLAHLTWLDALIIGLFQMLALLPGISRSGSTITGGLMRGLTRETAARFSFLLGIPAILGAGLFAVVDLLGAPDLAAQLPALAATFVAAGVVGYVCIYGLLRWLRQGSLVPFAVYCAVVSVLFLAWWLLAA